MKTPLVIITGASSGIGAAVAKLFSEAGFKLGLLARNVKAMEALHLPNSICIETDVTDINAVRQAFKKAEEKFGAVDCVINNAGVAKGGDFNQLTHEEHENTVKVNLLGVINCMEVAIPKMQSQKSGTIINVSSLADRNTRPNLATYAATKAAVKSLTESLRAANAKYRIRICNVAPAKIQTPLLVSSLLRTYQTIPVENMAKTILWIYQQPQSICVRDIVIAPTGYEG